MTQRSGAAIGVMGTVGLDVGDASCALCLLDGEGVVQERSQLRTDRVTLERWFAGRPRLRVVLEVGAHSPWISRLLEGAGHELVLANPRRVRLIAEADRKHDRADAETLARLGRVDPALLAPVRHRTEQAQADLAVLRARDGLVRARTLLINLARGTVKAAGGRLPRCSAESFHHRVGAALPQALAPALAPLVEEVGRLTEAIREMDRRVEALCAAYPVTVALRRVHGVGPVTALAFVLTLGEPTRFARSREVGPYLGLVPRQRASSGRTPQLHISKAGDGYLRRLLVGCARYIVGPFGEDCDLRRWGLSRAPAGTAPAQRGRVAVAVARRLAVLLHRLWVTGEVYDPHYRGGRAAVVAA